MGASTRSPESTAMSRTRCFFAETRLCAEPTTRPTSRTLNTHTRAHTHTSLALLSPNLVPNLVPNLPQPLTLTAPTFLSGQLPLRSQQPGLLCLCCRAAFRSDT